MTDGHAAEPPQDKPSSRALGAMESAVRRARESAGGASLPPPLPQRRTADSPAASPAKDQQLDRWLVTAVVVVAVLLFAAATGLVVSLATANGTPKAATPPSTVTTPSHGAAVGPAHHATGPGRGSPARPSPSSDVTTTTPNTAPASPGGPPVISALTPSSATAGQAVEIAGSNFLSSNGQIVATFNGQVAPTNCPTQSTCNVTVPPSTGAPSVQVTINTAGGSSNEVTFTYR